MRSKNLIIVGIITGLLMSNIVGLYYYINQGKENTQLKNEVEGYRVEVNRLNKYSKELVNCINNSTGEIEKLEKNIKEQKDTIKELENTVKELEVEQ